MVEVGGRVVWRNGKALLAGAVPDTLILEIREQREAFLEEWDRYDFEQRQTRGWGAMPPADVPRRKKAPQWNAKQYRQMDQWVRRQPDEVVKWAFHRAVAYREQGWSERDASQAAIHDLWDWQTGPNRHADPADVVMALEVGR